MENIIEDAWGAEYANGIIPFFHKDSNGNIVSKEVTGGTYAIYLYIQNEKKSSIDNIG